MPFAHHTPEFLLERSDSKNPATTCKGLTVAGRPCRRALAASATSSPATTPTKKGNGVVAILDDGDAAAFFCWQHKDQADVLVAGFDQRTQVLPLRQKTSVDTLMERIGVLDLEGDAQDQDQDQDRESRKYDEVRNRVDRVGRSTARPRKRNTLPQEWQNIQGPLMSVPEEVASAQGYRRQRPPLQPLRDRYPTDRKSRSNVKASWGCCIQTDDEDRPPPRRRDLKHGDRRTRTETKSDSRFIHESKSHAAYDQHQSLSKPTHVSQRLITDSQSQRPSSSTVTYPQLGPLPENPYETSTRPLVSQRVSIPPQNFQTAALLSLIPTHLSPNTVSALLTELSKPISSADEDGYIYIFWLTPDSDASKPDDEIASSLLDPDDWSSSVSLHRAGFNNGYQQRGQIDQYRPNRALTAQALHRFASVKHGPTGGKKILLKIGRASNVHRRLTQWTKQCGQNITLIRYYPYRPQDRAGSNPSAIANNCRSETGTVPHVHRVERLIHLELADQRVAGKGKCEQCGRDHKEWFEVQATREGIKAVDQVVRKWVGWAQTTDM